MRHIRTALFTRSNCDLSVFNALRTSKFIYPSSSLVNCKLNKSEYGVNSTFQIRQSHQESYNEGKFNKRSNHLYYYGFFGAVGSLGVLLYNNRDKFYIMAKEKEPEGINIDTVGKLRKDLPTYTDVDVSKHNNDKSGVWVTYKDGVYDITKFVDMHPGGNEKILLAAGTSIETFWNIYPFHKKDEIYEMLEEYRIGNLKRTVEQHPHSHKTSDPFENDPPRHPLLNVLSQKPFNAETPIQFSVDSFITPNDFHFKRNHLPVPEVDISKYKLEVVDGISGKKVSFTLDDIKTKFPIYTIPVTIQCAGNRRKAMHSYKPVQGLMWGVNAISTANWTGIKLKDLLEHCGFKADNINIQHVQFEGLDHDPSGTTYGASIVKEKAFSDIGDVLIAFKMNNEDIPLDHGYPLRIVVPGVIGARSVKWLSKVIVSDKESTSHWQQKDYKLLSPTVSNLNEADFSKVKAVQESNVQSAICEPVDGATIHRENETLKVKGYAYSGGGNSIESVLVSFDDGQTWTQAKLRHRPYQALYRHWIWVLWEVEVDIPKDKDNISIICVATDSSENTQPETAKSIWNLRGLLNNSWHKINVKVK